MAERAAPRQIARQRERPETNVKEHDEHDLSEMLQELRILQQGVLVLTAFLTILPFSAGFDKIERYEKWVFIATFICSIASVVLFSAPAAQHRLVRPLKDRVGFKDSASRMTVVGLIPFSLALVLATQLVVSQVLGIAESLAISGAVALLLCVIWWALPLAHKQKDER